MAAEESSSSPPCHSSTDASLIYWKINQTPGPGLPRIPPLIFWMLFSIPPTGSQLMATLCSVEERGRAHCSQKDDNNWRKVAKKVTCSRERNLALQALCSLNFLFDNHSCLLLQQILECLMQLKSYQLFDRVGESAWRWEVGERCFENTNMLHISIHCWLHLGKLLAFLHLKSC